MRFVIALLVVLCSLPAREHSSQRHPPPTSRAISSAGTSRFATSRPTSSTSTKAACSARRSIERGTLLVKKPGMMRWVYTSPEKKEFVSDGRTLYSYMPDDRQVMVSHGARRPTTRAARRCSSRARETSSAISRASLVTVPEAAQDEVALKLVPTRPQRDYDWIILVVDRDQPADSSSHHDRRPGRNLHYHLHEAAREHRGARQGVCLLDPARRRRHHRFEEVNGSRRTPYALRLTPHALRAHASRLICAPSARRCVVRSA